MSSTPTPTADAPTVASLRVEYAKLLDPAEPLDSRMREVYRLKEAHLTTPAGVAILLEAIDTTDSVLLQHELAYNVGQSGVEAAVEPLSVIVTAIDKYDEVTRHEAAESLGAIGSPRAVALLEAHTDPSREPSPSVRETCELALVRIAMQKQQGAAAMAPPAGCPYVSVDPSPAFTTGTDGVAAVAAVGGGGGGLSQVPTTVPELEAVLLDCTGATRLFTRYMAMFTLRNLGTSAAVASLCRALREDTTSCLFRHEVAFVLGQLEHPESQPALVASLEDEAEAPMVRHEAAEALGAIADPRTLPVLERFATHPEAIVRDSCVVALEMHKYWANFNSLGKTGEEEEGEKKAAAAE